MITFKQYLEESRSAPLYHGTHMHNLKYIFFDKKGVLPLTSQANAKLLFSGSGKTHGVSTSRSMKFAARYTEGVILEFDQRLLSQQYKIVPVQYWIDYYKTARKKESSNKNHTPSNEYEEFIITDKPIPVKYIKCIWLEEQRYKTYLRNPRFHREELQEIEAIRQQYGSSFIKTHNLGSPY